MTWVLAVVLVLAALVGLALALLGVYRRVKALLRELGRASAAVSPAVEALTALESGGARRPPDAPTSPSRRR